MHISHIYRFIVEFLDIPRSVGAFLYRSYIDMETESLNQTHPSPEFEVGFVIVRHVNCEKSALYWKEAYLCIRAIYPLLPILIVDDNSNPTFLDDDQEFGGLYEGLQIVHSQFPGRGEILGYYYFWKLRPFRKAVIIHDSVFVQPAFRFVVDPILADLETARFLWHFEHAFDVPLEEKVFIEHISSQSGSELSESVDLQRDLNYFHSRIDLWRGMFGVMSIVHWNFLSHLHDKYSIFSLVEVVKTRGHRSNMERVFAMLFTIEDSGCITSVFGDIFGYPKPYPFSWDDYLGWLSRKWRDPMPVLKVWTGR